MYFAHDKHKINYLKRIPKAIQNDIFFSFAQKKYNVGKRHLSPFGGEFLENLLTSLEKHFERSPFPSSATSFSINGFEFSKEPENTFLKLVEQNLLIPENYTKATLEESGDNWRISYILAILRWIQLRKGRPLKPLLNNGRIDLKDFTPDQLFFEQTKDEH